MSKSSKYIVVLFLTFVRLFGQQKIDSLITFSNLEFKTDFERNTFREYAQFGAKTDIVDLFLVKFEDKTAFNSTEAHTRIKECVSDLLKATESVSEVKKIKIIYKEVHQRFFKKYNLRNSFSDIFEKGEYNCVSASALYAIILQKMNIPFQIIEAPQHVFLVAYPNTHKVLIESTVPSNGYLVFSDAQVNRFVKHLYDSKLISKEEYENKPAAELFNKYYFDSNGLSLLELAGVQYSNFAIYHSTDENYAKALCEIKKACFLSANERNKYLLEHVASYLVINNSYSEKKDVQNLCILCRFNGQNEKEVSNEKIKYEFGRIIQEQLINNSNESEFENSYNIISSCVSDSALKNELSFYFHYEMARVGYQKQKSKEFEIPHLKKAYAIKSKNSDLQAIIRAYCANQIDVTTEPKMIMATLNEFNSTFDFLNTDQAFNSVRANCLLELCYQNYMLNLITQGETYRNEFEQLADSQENFKPAERYVEKAYSTAASYYFKKGNKNKTREILKKGISYAPQNFGLQIRLNQVH